MSRPSVVLPEQPRETTPATAEQGDRCFDVGHRGSQGDRVWLTTDRAADYVGCPTRKAFRQWAQRRGIVLVERGEGGRLLVAKADLDRALRVRKAR